MSEMPLTAAIAAFQHYVEGWERGQRDPDASQVAARIAATLESESPGVPAPIQAVLAAHGASDALMVWAWLPLLAEVERGELETVKSRYEKMTWQAQASFRDAVGRYEAAVGASPGDFLGRLT